MKPETDSISRRLRPNWLASQPVIGRMIALATRYEVSTQVASSIVAERLPAMCGSDTLTTVVSSTSMKVANMTERAMIQGLTCGCCSSVIDRGIRAPSALPQCLLPSCAFCLYFVYTVGVTDMPGRSRWSGSCPCSSTIFTGTRCTTFT